MIGTVERYQGCLVGCAVGDALGQPIEFLPKDEAKIAINPKAENIRAFRTMLQDKYNGLVTEMFNSPTRVFKEGEYTDDTDQTLDLTDTLIEKGLDPDHFSKKLIYWLDQLGGKGSGRTTREVIELFKQGFKWYEASEIALKNGAKPANGSLMRTSPIGLFFQGDPDKIDEAAATISRITHAHMDAITACQIASQLIGKLAEGAEKDEALEFVETRYPAKFRQVVNVDRKQYRGGALVTLSICLESFRKTGSFEEAVVKAVNNPGDCDSYGAITGAFAGTHYGIDNIPFRWQVRLNPLNVFQIKEKGTHLFLARLNQGKASSSAI